MKRQSTLLILASATLTLTIALPVLAQNYTSRWACHLKHRDNQYVGKVEPWWAKTKGDAEWACNAWISECGNNGGCWARRI
ncbi:conserved exported hypothetical protein [Hyella patelloides LEGE 07179]|uniref:Uncharacterized protein n=1 Tax=Hyella patelloides LEGE 07179 TaxID=945734 RepID=A0A563W3N1_9CYAN|nr:hypothetical protein [Hyella patelloides]VEP18286.1 conserved exported hypothetical protein [Hyella patelloides LEGE 07179]